MTSLPPHSQENGVAHKRPGRPQHETLYFLSPQAAEALPNFVYAGEDRSLLYKYILSPFAAFCVNRWTPRTVAPNTITLTGLCLMVLSYLVLYGYAPDLEVDLSMPPPSWVFFLNGIAMLVYQTLDNMDGKQARCTGSSSPLGLLFDHGCDAVNSVFGSANWIIAMGVNPARDFWSCWILVIGPMLLFYAATWEEYYSGALILPLVNGPSEGLFLGAMLSFTTGFLGVSFWQGTTWFDSFVDPFILPLFPAQVQSYVPLEGLTNADIIVIGTVLGTIQEVGQKAMFVPSRYGLESLWKMFPFVAMTILWSIIGFYDKNVWIRMPRTSLNLCSGLFVEMCTQLMLDHVTVQRFQHFRWTLLPLVVLTGLVVSGQWETSRTTDDYLMVYTAALWAYTLMRMTVVIHEACAILNIWCFDIVTPRKPTTGQAVENGIAHAASPFPNENDPTLRKTK